MTLSSILNAAGSGISTSQTGLRVVSDNIANVNTPGYVRKIVDQVPLISNARGQGVGVLQVRRVTDVYLENALQNAMAVSGEAGTIAEVFDRAQSLFGDPSSDGSYFNRLDPVYSAFNAASASPGSSLQRSQIVSEMTGFLNDTSRIYNSLKDLQTEADSRLKAGVSTINDLLAGIESLNADIVRATMVNGDATGSQSVQRGMISELSKYMDIKVSTKANGATSIIGGDSLSLVGNGAAVLSYSPDTASFGDVVITAAGSGSVSLRDHISSGSMVGFQQSRDVELPGIMNQLSEYSSHAIEELNRAHNASSSVPAPQTLKGRNTGLDITSAVTGFTGTTTVAVMSATDTIARSVAIDFSTMTMSVNGGAPSTFGASTFVADLNTALGGQATATFFGGVLSIGAASATTGIAIADSATVPSAKAGKTFGHFFGLNDLVTSSGISTYDTGLTTTSAHGFTAGGVLGLRLNDSDGRTLADVNVTVPAGTQMSDMLAALNSPTTGVGLYGSFALDANGRLGFTASSSTLAQVSVRSDTTERGTGGPAFSALFGVGDTQRAARSEQYSLRTDIVQDPNRLAMAKLNLSPGAGQPALRAGDGSGATALGAAGTTLARFDRAGSIAAGSMSATRYAAQFAGSLARNAAYAESRRVSSDAISTEAENRRASTEDVNVDEELIKLTTYQQAFNASARMVTAAKELYDILLNMV
jgi:flagellar hook-associated protein 1 FlgK